MPKIDVSDLVQDAVVLARTVAPLVVPGAGAVLQVAERAAVLVKRLKDRVGEGSLEGQQLDDALNDLRAAVKAHEAQTFANLDRIINS